MFPPYASLCSPSSRLNFHHLCNYVSRTLMLGIFFCSQRWSDVVGFIPNSSHLRPCTFTDCLVPAAGRWAQFLETASHKPCFSSLLHSIKKERYGCMVCSNLSQVSAGFLFLYSYVGVCPFTL